jgi:alpha-beta hydrolase superfamily lysophospholipase
MKWLKRGFYTALVLFVLLNVMAIFHAWQFTHFYPDAEKIDLKSLSAFGKIKVLFFGYQFPKSVIQDRPTTPFEEVSLTSTGNLKISGWLSRTDSSRNAVILFHGHGGTKGSLVNHARYFNNLGFSTLTIDFRAHGESEGTTCTVGFNEAEEVKLSFEYMKQQGFDKIAFYGTSMGAAAIVKAINIFQMEPDRVILEMPFGSLQDAVKGRMRLIGIPTTPFSQLLTFWGGIEQGYWAFNFSPCNDAIAIKCPVLLQWGDQDVRVQRHETECIYSNISTEKKLVVYEGAGHQSLYKYDANTWEKEVKNFLTR